MGKSLLRRKDKTIPAHLEADPTEARIGALGAVMDFRDKMETDPEFQRSFVDSVREALLRGEIDRAAEADKHADAFGGNSVYGREMTDKAKGAKVGMLNSVLGLMRWAAEGEDFDAAVFLDQLRDEVGNAVNEAYGAGLREPDPQFYEHGTLGVTYQEIGSVVVVDRILESGIDIRNWATGGQQ